MLESEDLERKYQINNVLAIIEEDEEDDIEEDSMLNDGHLYNDVGVNKSMYRTALATEGRMFIPTSPRLKSPHEGIFSPDLDSSGLLKTPHSRAVSSS